MVLLLALLFVQDQPPAQPWTAHQQAARTAREAKDWTGYRTHLVALNELFYGHPTIVYSLAAAEAQLGNGDQALGWLTKFAAMGLFQDISKDATFAALRDLPAYQQVVKRMAGNLEPVSHGKVAFALPESGIIAEDIAWDARGKRFFISSVRRRKIMVTDSAGHVSDFISSGRDGIWSVLALAVDAKRGVLWASTAAMPHGEGYDAKDAGRTALLKYDLRTAALLKRYDLAANSGQHVLGDMTISRAGDVFVSDSVGGPVYTIRNERLEAVCDKRHFRSPQTPALLPGEKKLFVADYGRGIAIVDLATRDVSWLKPTADLSLIGIDGLYRAGRDLIVVQNGTSPMRIIRMKLDATFTHILSWQTIEANTPGFGSPSHGVVVGDSFYFLANTGWDSYDDNGVQIPKAKLTAPAVWRMSLH